MSQKAQYKRVCSRFLFAFCNDILILLFVQYMKKVNKQGECMLRYYKLKSEERYSKEIYMKNRFSSVMRWMLGLKELHIIDEKPLKLTVGLQLFLQLIFWKVSLTFRVQQPTLIIISALIIYKFFLLKLTKFACKFLWKCCHATNTRRFNFIKEKEST